MSSIVEQWKAIAGYEELYEVSDQGNVRSVPGTRWNGLAMHYFKGKILRQQSSGRYLHVALSKNGKVKTARIHQLVAAAFLSKCPGKQGRKRGCYHVDHINNNPHDNRAVNLQWLTHYENTYAKANRIRDEAGRFANNSI